MHQLESNVRRVDCRFCRDDHGATAIEYALIAAVVAIMAVSALSMLGGETGGMWADTGDEIVDGLQRNQAN